jgi:hypothetical protein
MREARIIFPTEPLARERTRFEHDLVSAFGGFTRTIGDGGWAGDDGKTVYETVSIYDVAMEDAPTNARQLKVLAVQYGRLLAQEAVYVRFASGAVEIIPMKAKSDPAASPVPASHTPVGYPGLNKAEQAFLDRVADPEGVVRVRGVDRPLAEFDKPLGTKRLPKAGEAWTTSIGGVAVVTHRSSVLDGGYNCVVVKAAGDYASPGWTFSVNLDGKVLRDHSAHPLDLVRFVSAF